MEAGLLFAMTLPGVVVLLLLVAVVEHLAARRGRPGPVTRRRRHGLSASGLDAFSAVLVPGKADELAERAVQEQLRDDDGDGAPALPGLLTGPPSSRPRPNDRRGVVTRKTPVNPRRRRRRGSGRRR
jgi:hypothetical protein